MNLFLAWLLYPLVLLALSGGLGLLADHLSGRRIPGALVFPCGIAGLIVVAAFTTLSSSTAELTVPVVVALAVLGAGFSWPWRFNRPDSWLLAAAIGTFCVFGAPVVLSGEPTLAGYIKLDDTATWIAMTDRLMGHGRDLSGLEPSTYRATLEAYIGAGYPVGANLPWGVATKLMGLDPAWTFQPYLALLASMLCLCLGAICRPFLDNSARLSALVAFLASQAALFVGYYLWGGMKEMAAAMLIAGAAALLGLAVRGPSERSHRLFDARVTLPLALLAVALADVLSPAGLLWIGPLLVGGAALAIAELGFRGAVWRGVWFVAVAVVLGIPLIVVGHLTPPVEHAVTDPSAVLNLLQPLHPLQVLGVWPSGDFRFRPDHLTLAWFVSLLAAGLGIFGAYLAARHRAWRLLAYVATSVLACGVIVFAGSPWVDGKAMATATPAFLLAALVGASAIYQRGLRIEGGLLLAALGAVAIWSNVLAYGGVSLAPYGQLRELETIGKEFAGQGPTLMTEYNPYGARHFLREADGEGASELRMRPVPLRDGGSAEKGDAVDLDQLSTPGLLEFRTLVIRRSPIRSRPPSPYSLVRSGAYYEVWQRPTETSTSLVEHLPLGEDGEPDAIPSCDEVRRLAETASSVNPGGARLVAARHPPVFETVDDSVTLPRASAYRAWIEGSVRGEVVLDVDGHRFGAARHQLENDGGFIELGEGALPRGRQRVELHLGPADLHPGSGGFPRPATGPVLFVPARGEAGVTVSVPAAKADRLCGQRWDWIDAIA